MNWLVRNIKWIMLVSGLLTCTMVYAAVAPQAALHATFGETLSGPLAEIIVRNWGILITLIGAMLVYGAFVPPSRTLILTVAGLSKLSFVVLVLSHGGRYLGQQAGIAIGVDALWVLLFACLVMCQRGEAAPG
jgi:hypothetical protein